MLDVAVGLCLVFALFAGLVSGVQEIVAQVMGRRGKTLQQGIAVLLGDLSNATNGWDWLRNLLPWAADKSGTTTAKIFAQPIIDTLSQPNTKPSYIPSSNFAEALVQVLSNGGTIAGLRGALNDRNSHLGKLFGPMLDEANGDIERFKGQVEQHFDAVMDRVQGWYKRGTQWLLAVIALIVAVALNVDTIHIVRRLESDSELRAKLATTAVNVSLAAKSTPSSTDPSAVKDLKDRTHELSDQVDTLKQLGIPVGWTWLGWKAGNLKLLDKQDWTAAPFGWLLTAFAGMLGAPFWFDALSRLIAVRGTGKKPEDSAAAAKAVQPAEVTTSAPATPVAYARSALDDFEANRLTADDIEALQRALGFSESRADGILSEAVRSALRDWQRTKGQPPSGRFDEPTVMALLYPA